MAHMKSQAVPPLVAAVLCSRGLSTLEAATDFLSWHPRLLQDPFLMKDMEKAVSRIEQALSAGEKISVYGDYDVDGITSTCLLTHYLRGRGGTVCYYIPCRMDEGYGVNREAIDALHAEGVSLVITVDCGITAVEETAYAKALGIDLVITDHHTCKEEIPQAVAVVDPHQPDCPYPFKDLAGVGVALKLVMAMEGPEKRRQVLEEYADLAAVGTVADVMKLLGENRTLVHLGLEQLKETRRVGLTALMEEAGTNAEAVTSTTVGYCLAPRINAAGRMGQAAIAAELILTEDGEQASRLAKNLCALNRERQEVELQIFNQCIKMLEQTARHDCIVLADEGWHQGVVGIVASRLSEKYACPVCMISLQDGKGKGSCRSYGGFNLFQALEACSDLLEGYGGHALAAGFTILEEQIDAFRSRMSQLVLQNTGGEEVVSTLSVDVEVSDVHELFVESVTQLSMLEPYGSGNPKPVFCLLDATVTCMSDVGGGRHLKMRVGRDGRSQDAIFFSVTGAQAGVKVGDVVDLAFYPQINEFRGVKTVQLHLIDLRPSAERNAQEAARYAQFCRGEAIAQETAREMLPKREEFAALWRQLSGNGGKLQTTAAALARAVAQKVGGSASMARIMVCLDVLRECSLVEVQDEGEVLHIFSRSTGGEKMDLEQTALLRRLRELAGQEV